jgi:hypothetical protein
MSGLRQFAADEEQSRLEIMTAAGSPLHEYLRRGVDAQFVEIIQSNGGQLLKILNPVSLLELMTAGTLLDMPTVKVRDTEDHVFLGTADHSSNGFSNEFSIPKRQLPGLLSGFLSGAPNPRMQSFADTLKCNFLGRLRDQTPFIFQGDNY